MGTILRVLGLLFVIHTRDHEPPHVTIYRGTPENFEAIARIEIETGRVMSSHRFSTKRLGLLVKIVRTEREYLREKWNESRPK